MKEETRWCYACGETKPLTSKYFCYKDKTHTKFSNKCRECSNFDSRMSHAKARARKKDEKEKGEQ